MPNSFTWKQIEVKRYVESGNLRITHADKDMEPCSQQIKLMESGDTDSTLDMAKQIEMHYIFIYF